MPDAFGLVSAPMPIPDDNEEGPPDAAGDPALSIVLKFLQAFLNDNAQDAWNAVAPGQKVVQTSWPHKPALSFNQKNLPALFGWREGDTKEDWVGDGVLVSTSDWTILWVMPWAPQERQVLRAAFRNAIGKLCNLGLERGRTPSFVVTGDADPLAATQGSLLYPLLGMWSMNLKKTKAREFNDVMPGNDPHVFEALEMTFEVAEKLAIGLDKYKTVVGTDVTITNPVDIVDHVTTTT